MHIYLQWSIEFCINSIHYQALFNGISALKYRMPGPQRIWRSLILEQDVFFPPEDGWGDRVYLSSFPAGRVYLSAFPAGRDYPSSIPAGRVYLPAFPAVTVYLSFIPAHSTFLPKTIFTKKWLVLLSLPVFYTHTWKQWGRIITHSW